MFKEDYDTEEAKQILEKYIRENLAYHLRPVQINTVTALPVTKSGKIDYFRADRVKKTN